MEKPSGIRILLADPWAQPLNSPKESGRKDKKRSAIIPVRTIPDARRQPRFKIEVDITINSRTCGMLKGQTVDISESGVAAMLRIEAPHGRGRRVGPHASMWFCEGSGDRSPKERFSLRLRVR
jgi:hypothetical protein